MRKLLILSVLALLTASAGCASNSCGGGWRPGYYLFGAGRNQPASQCCDPCGGSGAMMSAPMMQAPCCE